MSDNERTKELVLKVDNLHKTELNEFKELATSWQTDDTLNTEIEKDIAAQKATLTKAMLALAPRCEAKVCSSCKIKD